MNKNEQKKIVGLHTMVNEHFGINIVEFMAAGLSLAVPVSVSVAGVSACVSIRQHATACVSILQHSSCCVCV